MPALMPVVRSLDLSAAFGGLHLTTRILVVGDTGFRIHVLADLLRDHAIDALAFESRRRAIEAVHDGRYDILLMELRKPRLQWIGFISAVLAANPGIAVVVVTASPSVHAGLTSRAHPRLHCLRKVALLPQLIEALARREQSSAAAYGAAQHEVAEAEFSSFA